MVVARLVPFKTTKERSLKKTHTHTHTYTPISNFGIVLHVVTGLPPIR